MRGRMNSRTFEQPNSRTTKGGSGAVPLRGTMPGQVRLRLRATLSHVSGSCPVRVVCQSGRLLSGARIIMLMPTGFSCDKRAWTRSN